MRATRWWSRHATCIPQQRGYISKDGMLTERFSRWDDKQIVYEFTVDDPSQYSQPWKGEMAFNCLERAVLRIRLP